MKKKIALFGGSFDPPHYGHIFTIATVLNSKLADKIWLVPSGKRDDKKLHTSVHHRQVMMEIMISTNFGSRVPVFIEDYDLRQERHLPTIELVQAMRKTYPDYDFLVVIGADLVRDIKSKWVRGEKLIKTVNFLVIPRLGVKLPKTLPPTFKTLPMEQSISTNLSSSVVRQMIKQGKNIEAFIPPAVIAYFLRYKLY